MNSYPWTPADLQKRAGDAVYHRALDVMLTNVGWIEYGTNYVRAQVRGTAVYLVQFFVDGDQFEATCTCPHADQGNFCKHQVAVGLRTHLDHRQARVLDSTLLLESFDAAVKRHISEASVSDLRSLASFMFNFNGWSDDAVATYYGLERDGEYAWGVGVRQALETFCANIRDSDAFDPSLSLPWQQDLLDSLRLPPLLTKDEASYQRDLIKHTLGELSTLHRRFNMEEYIRAAVSALIILDDVAGRDVKETAELLVETSYDDHGLVFRLATLADIIPERVKEAVVDLQERSRQEWWDPSPRTGSFYGLVDAYDLVGRSDDALQLLIEEPNPAHGEIVNRYLARGDIGRADEWILRAGQRVASDRDAQAFMSTEVPISLAIESRRAHGDLRGALEVARLCLTVPFDEQAYWAWRATAVEADLLSEERVKVWRNVVFPRPSDSRFWKEVWTDEPSADLVEVPWEILSDLVTSIPVWRFDDAWSYLRLAAYAETERLKHASEDDVNPIIERMGEIMGVIHEVVTNQFVPASYEPCHADVSQKIEIYLLLGVHPHLPQMLQEAWPEYFTFAQWSM